MNTATRLLWLVAGFFFGHLTSSLLFLWVALDCHLPFLSSQSTNNGRLVNTAIYNIILFLLWGFAHSFFAQEKWNTYCINTFHVPKPAMRLLYYIITGINTVILIFLWKPSNVQLWSLPFLDKEQNMLLSLILYLLFMLPNGRHIRSLGLGEFLGISQLFREDQNQRSFGTAKLVTTGFYSQMRHPIYTFTLMAFTITNSCSLDRAWFITASLIYLYFAIPVEEQKLIQLFGHAYREYQKKVPAVIPAFILRNKIVKKVLSYL